MSSDDSHKLYYTNNPFVGDWFFFRWLFSLATLHALQSNVGIERGNFQF